MDASPFRAVFSGSFPPCLGGEISKPYAVLLELGDNEAVRAIAEENASRLMENLKAGDTMFFGSFEQDGNEGNGPEPLQWRVLEREGDYVLLLSEHLLRYTTFGGNNEWGLSEVRTWLNGEFYDAAFSGEERGRIQNVLTYGPDPYELDTIAAELYEQYREENPEEMDREGFNRALEERFAELGKDKVFLLSAQEARGFFSEDKDRVSSLTRAVETLGSTGTSDWWTRSRTRSGKNQVVVTVEYAGEVEILNPSHDAGVRPVICLSLSEKTTDEALNLELFGYPSDTDLFDAELESEGPSSGKCPACGGTGMIRYNYGSSDLEAWLTGHDAYTLDTCPMCHGRGWV